MHLGRILIVSGLALALLGLLVSAFPGFRPGRLPGDVAFGSGNVRVFFPLGTSLLLSVILTLLLWVVTRR
jgi:hypothetical protein